MAAGDVTVLGDFIPDVGGSTGDYRVLWGTVQLDGSNPTPIDLANYVQSIDFSVCTLVSVAPPADDPTVIGISTSAAVINIEAYKHTNTDCPTLTDSGDNADSVAWFAIGPARGARRKA